MYSVRSNSISEIELVTDYRVLHSVPETPWMLIIARPDFVAREDFHSVLY